MFEKIDKANGIDSIVRFGCFLLCGCCRSLFWVKNRTQHQQLTELHHDTQKRERELARKSLENFRNTLSKINIMSSSPASDDSYPVPSSSGRMKALLPVRARYAMLYMVLVSRCQILKELALVGSQIPPLSRVALALAHTHTQAVMFACIDEQEMFLTSKAQRKNPQSTLAAADKVREYLCACVL